MSGELLIEIGTEEIPAGFVPVALEAMERILTDLLSQYRIGISGKIRTIGTPRRLTVTAVGLDKSQSPRRTEKIGPPASKAFDENGKPNKMAEGFAKGQGVKVEDLVRIETDKGEYLAAVIEDAGRPTVELLPEMIERLIGEIPFKKSMRWMNLDVRFGRPVHWILALFDGAVVPVSFGNVKSGDKTRGHRFMAPGEIAVKDFVDYLKKLEKAFVVCDPEERKKIIEEGVGDVAKAFGGAPLPNPELVDEVVYLTEFPVAVGGSFPKEYLKLPVDVLVTSMRSHQRYFGVVDKGGKLLPHFVTVSNTKAKDNGVVSRGNERVLVARLEDAKFYFEEDTKVPLKNRVEDLKGVVFHSKLGTSYEKVMRFRELSGWLADKILPEKKEAVMEAAYLAKADLDTGMVQEFPSLQGKIGREYALRDGIAPEIAEAIYEHYMPVGARDDIPKGEIGTIVSLSDKMDTICGFFGVGMTPTGTADPYALRRSVIAIINIILGKGIRLSLVDFIDRSIEILEGKATRGRDELKADVADFFRGRLAVLLADTGFPQDVVDAVLTVSIDDLVLVKKRAEAIMVWKKRPEFSDLATSIKRVGNIIKGKDAEEGAGDVDEKLLAESAERELLKRLEEVEKGVGALIVEEKYNEAVGKLLELKGPIDKFFDDVMVMDENPDVRQNRLSILGRIKWLFMNICDFQKIEQEK
ncbi:MAG: glycine--tRNA ligase subunit beta [Deltaproteobacteria bacterium]|uniref:Glycine--tRNA ligase beta subunit n=1 Tax=Candidatus Zymogenus saltonus TaxID=2844893 RepID=A0A9D8KH49_9DELT|nr:glycine--tRNA ligase subunit beta [Candidatus Zymogenus saltonus]